MSVGPIRRSIIAVWAWSLIAVFSVGAGAAECADLSRKNVLAHSAPKIDAFAWSKLGTKVVILGEEHATSRATDLVRILDKLNPDRAHPCLFLEMPTSLSIEDFKRIIHSEPADPGQSRYVHYYRSIVDGAEAAGYVVHPVDHPRHLDDEVSINERDQAMAQNVNGLLNDGLCPRGVLIVGKAHVTPDEPGRTLIRKHLDDLHVSSTTINAQYAREWVADPQFSSWNGLCPAAAIPFDDPVVFANDSIADLPLYPRYSPLPRIGDFDWTVLFPN